MRLRSWFMSELRPALVFPGCHPRGGVERVVWETMRHLSLRHPVVVVASDVEANGSAGVSVDLVQAPRRPRSLFPLLWRAAAARRVSRLDRAQVVSYGVNCPPGDVLVVQSVHRSWLELGRALQYHGAPVPARLRWALPRHQVLLTLERSYFKSSRPRRVVAVSDNVAHDLQRFYCVPPERIVVVPNGYSPEQCSPDRAAALRAEMREQIGLAARDVALLLVANEWHRKGLSVLLDAVAALGTADVHVVLVGRMAPKSYQPKIARLGLAERVHYCGPTGDVARFHAAADVFVMPTQYEAFGSVVVEALASGLPVITTSRAGAAAAVHPGVNGLLQEDPDDARELAGLLRQALDPDVRAGWASAAPGSVRGYEWSSVMAKIEAIFAETAA